jgi:hypothetical protein
VAARGVGCPNCKAIPGTSCIDLLAGGYARSVYHPERALAAETASVRMELDAVFSAKLRAETTAVEQKEQDARVKHSLSLERDAAVSLLLETPVGCDEMTCNICGGAPLADEPCGKCWACRVDKFLRDAGVRR